MTAVLVFIISSIIAYLIGAFPTGFLLTRLFSGVDIRKSGSQNVGATNVYRVAGKLPGFLTLIIDIGKGVLSVTVAANYFYTFLPEVDYDFYRVFMGFLTICGHIWPVFLKFKGGKGVAATIGVSAAISPPVAFASLAVWLVFFVPTNYVSVGSIAFGIALPMMAILFNQSIYVVIFYVIVCLINTYKHRSNISRLLEGKESKTMLFNKKVNKSKS